MLSSIVRHGLNINYCCKNKLKMGEICGIGTNRLLYRYVVNGSNNCHEVETREMSREDYRNIIIKIDTFVTQAIRFKKLLLLYVSDCLDIPLFLKKWNLVMESYLFNSFTNAVYPRDTMLESFITFCVTQQSQAVLINSKNILQLIKNDQNKLEELISEQFIPDMDISINESIGVCDMYD